MIAHEAPGAPEAKTLGVLLLAGDHERAHYAFCLVAAAAALGRPALLFATNRGCLALMRDWQVLAESGRDKVIQQRGLAGLETLRAASIELGVRLMACEAGLRAEALDRAGLLPQVEVAGIASFLHEVGAGQIVTL
jgi:peroxiredoxin family protein